MKRVVCFGEALIDFLRTGGDAWFADRAAIAPLLESCDILKVSAEELEYLSGGKDKAFIHERLERGVRLVLVTDGGNPVSYHGEAFNGAITPEACKVVDTTAAGDAFTGGMLFGLAQSSGVDHLFEEPDALAQLVKFAIACGAHAVKSAGAFPSLPSFSDVDQYRI